MCNEINHARVQKRSPDDAEVPLKHQLLQIIVRVLQYRMLLTGNTSALISSKSLMLFL